MDQEKVPQHNFGVNICNFTNKRFLLINMNDFGFSNYEI